MVRYRVAVVLVTVAVLGAACTSGGDDPPAPPAPALVEAWRVGRITPIGQPVAAGDMVVAYGADGKDLLLFGVTVAEGVVRWRQAASPGRVAGGTPVTPRVLDGRVAYFRPDPIAPLAARLVVASPQTGADLLVSEPLQFAAQPTACADGRDVCVSVIDGNRTVSRRFSVESAGPVPDPGAAPPGARFVGDDLLDVGQRRPELLAGFQDGTVRWRSPLSRHFSEGHSTDLGWYFELYRSAGLHVGSVGRPDDGRDATTVVVDLSKAETAAIRAADGSSAWRAEGTRFLCDARIVLQRRLAATEYEAWPVRCRSRGTARYDRVTEAATFEGLDVTVEGFDLASGDTTWSVPLGAATAFMDGYTRAAVVSEVEVLVQGAAGPMIIDLSTGTTRVAAAGEAFWCARDVTFEFREAKQFADGSSLNRWRGGEVLRRCAADGSATAATPSSIAPSLGATVGARTVVADAEGLVAYDRTGS